jgi:hypothetical protein
MCCDTHDLRDAIALYEASASASDAGSAAAALEAHQALLAESEGFRCRCPHGVPCKRKADAEDLLCEWCRGTDHALWYAARAPGRPAPPGAYAYMDEAARFSSGAPYELADTPAYSGDFYQAGVVSGFEVLVRSFEIPAGTLEAGMPVRFSVEGHLTPSEIRSVLGLPNL